jgi:sec-independent protein translocase protein TatA
VESSTADGLRGTTIRVKLPARQLSADGAIVFGKSEEFAGRARTRKRKARRWMGGMSLMHWVVVLVVFLLLFGAGRISEVGKGLGEGIRNFKKGLEGDDEPKKPAELDAPKPASSAKKVIQIEVGEGEDEAEALKRVAAEKAAKKSSASSENG